jgi:hypothetical protein
MGARVWPSAGDSGFPDSGQFFQIQLILQSVAGLFALNQMIIVQEPDGYFLYFGNIS